MKWKFTLTNAIEGDLILSDEPIGWADIVLNVKRDMKWHGVFFEYTLNLQFYGEGYNYLKKIYDTQSREAYVGILVEVQCNDSAGYSDFYLGKLVMVKIVFDCQDNCIATCPIDPAGCLMEFKNRIDQPVDLNANKDFDGNLLAHYSKLPFVMSLLPKAIILRELADRTYPGTGVPITQYDSDIQTVAPDITGGSQSIYFIDYMSLPTGTFTLNEIAATESLGCIMANSTSIIPVLDTAPNTANYNVDVNIPLLDFATIDGLTGGAAASFDLVAIFYITVNGVPVYTSNILSTSSEGRYVLGPFHYNYDVPMNIGDVLKTFIRITTTAVYPRNFTTGYHVYITYNWSDTLSPLPYTGHIDACINIKETILNEATPCSVFAINESLSRTVEAITDDCMRVKSNYFGRTDSQPYTSGSDGCGSLEVITKGLLIRNFPVATTIMPVSFKQLFDSLNSIHNIGIGIEPDAARGGYDVIRVEPMEYFYDTTVLLTFENVPAIKKTSKPEWDPSTIELGYEKWETWNTMGLDEFCTKRSYRTTLKEVQNGVSNLCQFIASGYSIEITRQQQWIAQSTTDFRYDNDVFIICVRRDGGNIVLEQGITCANTGAMTNIIDPDTIYNYRISPVRNLMRWIKAYMAAYFTDINAVNAKFIFTNGDGNFVADGELITGCIEEAAAIKENADINVASFANANHAKPIFKNELDEFDYPLSLSEFNLIQANPRGTIKYRNKNSDPYSQGFIFDIQYKPNEGIGTFTLLPKYK